MGMAFSVRCPPRKKAERKQVFLTNLRILGVLANLLVPWRLGWSACGELESLTESLDEVGF